MFLGYGRVLWKKNQVKILGVLFVINAGIFQWSSISVVSKICYF